MKRSMLDILACPIDKHYPLELHDIEAAGDDIRQGVLFCAKCGRYYPVIDGIPVMLPDELRNKERDTGFLEKWKEKIPEKILRQGNPWHL
ncbi:Trm112 family protein [Candidatus Nitrososphaera sp. FF02]|uniref:Trm112 family protein n=1 Tax=Candidatus Nitrososphaera sp. FF02 TaxID=3398226 RepID=UPI0039E7BF96